MSDTAERIEGHFVVMPTFAATFTDTGELAASAAVLEAIDARRTAAERGSCPCGGRWRTNAPRRPGYVRLLMLEHSLACESEFSALLRTEGFDRRHIGFEGVFMRDEPATASVVAVTGQEPMQLRRNN